MVEPEFGWQQHAATVSVTGLEDDIAFYGALAKYRAVLEDQVFTARPLVDWLAGRSTHRLPVSPITWTDGTDEDFYGWDSFDD